MERRKSEDISTLLMRFMRESGLESPLNQYRLVEAWTALTDPPVAAHTEQAFIRNQTLHVKLKSPALRAELSMRRKSLVRRLNASVGAEVITDIVFS